MATYTVAWRGDAFEAKIAEATKSGGTYEKALGKETYDEILSLENKLSTREGSGELITDEGNRIRGLILDGKYDSSSGENYLRQLREADQRGIGN
jgi:hypothetical protein